MEGKRRLIRHLGQQVQDSVILGDLYMSMGEGSSGMNVLDRAADQLREDVLSGAQQMVDRMRLEQPTMIQISWKGSDRTVQPARDVLGVAPEELKGTVTQVPDVCRELPRHQLVVQGGPGTGKSVLAILLVHDMAGTPCPGDPVPVLMPLSSWRRGMSMRKWMLRQIRQSSPKLADRGMFGADVAGRLLTLGKVMPVLDGLDELPESLQAEAVRRIDRVIPKNGWLLVTCRGKAYERARREGYHFTRAAVIELDDVKTESAIGYLNESKLTGDGRWDPVFEAIRSEPESALAKAMASPLLLYLARTAYGASSTDPGELLSTEKFSSQEDIEDALLERYLPAVYTEEPPSRYTEDRARRYLTLMARQMRRDRTVDFAWWQINSLMTGPLVGLAFGGVWGWFFHELFGLGLGGLTGILVGSGGWFAHAMVRADLRQVYVPEGAVHGPKALLRRYALIGAASALAVAGAMGASVGLWLARELGAESSTAWDYGLKVGVVSGAATLLGSAWGSFQASRLWFWLRRRLPWRLLPFLDDAHALGVLRPAGPIHQFRHQRVQRQLGGTPHEKPSRSVHGQWNAKWQRWRPLLPVFSNAVQVVSALSALALVSLMYAKTTQVELAYRSGDEPGLRAEVGHCSSLPSGTPCMPIPVLQWELPQGASRYSVWLPKRLNDRSLTSWDGRVEASGCAGATVEVTLAMKAIAPAVFKLADSDGVPTPELSHSVPPERRPVSVTLRRLDDRPCTLLVEWIDPGLVDDGLEPARKRLGVAGAA